MPVNVVNATGASGVTGHTRGALARPDGYTLTLGTAELNMLHWRGFTPITYESFQPAVLLNRDPAAIFVHKDSPWQSLEELNKHILANPRRLQASGTALGGIWHVAMAGWLKAIETTPDAVRWISIEGATPSLQELMAGGLDFVSCSLPEARSLLEAGEIICLGVMAENRLDQFPNVPTFREQGVETILGTWRGVFLPLDTPEDRAQILTQAIERAVMADEFRTFMDRAGFNWSFESGETFIQSLARQDQEFGAVLTSDAFAQMSDDVIGASAFPALLGVLGILVFGSLIWTKQIGLSESAEIHSRLGWLRIGAVILAIAAYLLLAEIIGFVITATVLVLALMRCFQVRWGMALPVTLILVPIVYHIFAVLLRVPLPRGIFGW